MTNVMQLTPPTFAPGPVDGAALTQAFQTFYREVLSRMDLRYPNNDFGGLGTMTQVLTSNGGDIPSWQDNLPSIANDTVLGNVSGSTAVATAITEAQLTALINIFTALLPGAVPASGGGTTKFLRADASWQVPGGGSQATTILQGGGASQTYNVPATANWLDVFCIGGGGGGSSGGRATTAITVWGGGGGGGGGISYVRIPAAVVRAVSSSVTVTFANAATGGNGGAAYSGTSGSSGGTAGVAGSAVSFGPYLNAYGGAAGNTAAVAGGGGVGAAQAGTSGGTGSQAGTATVGGQTTNASFASTCLPNTGGGGGGGVQSTGSLFAAAAGGSNNATTPALTLAGGTAGSNGGGTGGTGSSGGGSYPSSGGGGGGANNTSGGTGGSGGPGGTPGGGGGGGGGSFFTTGGGPGASGPGGQGGSAACIVIAW